ncbi:MAG: protein jag [Clostridiales bacterium]|nr:protein jag [Clostridiales bacterium]
MKCVERSAKTIEEAVDLALKDLNLTKDKVDIEVLEQPSKGLFGLIGGKPAKVKVCVKEEEKKDEIKELIKKDSAEDKKKEKEIAYRFLREVLDSMDIKAEIKIKYTETGLYINLIGPRMGIVIGKRGQTLDALQYLTSLVVNKNRGKDGYVRIILDTANYRKKREETLIRLANRLADKVERSRKKIELEPMNPYERRIIHSTLQNHPGVFTYSEGEEPNRKVIIACK